ncbi:diguanylate cyclase [Paenibacillus sp. F411]|uniref:sensor domain-containing diguanylate cyclase n=1 Tax=Paenibacillus sp. F411 TaxID=2820239 RepID=UPI001AAE70C8|nr:diguanylate cyclase [Paenibacillus sp. F411]MBO2944945.1 diguanylate cyclase [Paenibacillus sp. F411]
MSEEQRKASSASCGTTALPDGAASCGLISRSAGTRHHDLDITIYDQPYLQPIMEESFLEWKSEASSLLSQVGGEWAVLNSEGVWLAGDAALQDYFLAGDDETLQRVLRTGQPAAAVSDAVMGGRTVCAVPLQSRTRGELFGALVRVSLEDKLDERVLVLTEAAGLLLRSCFYRGFQSIFVNDLEKVYVQAAKEARQRSILFQYIKRMHSRIDVDKVLTEVMESILGLYPEVGLELFMSQDHESNHPLVKPLLLHHWQEEIYVRTFMEGTVTTLHRGSGEEARVEIGVPVGGKQGVYGVLHLKATGPLMEELDVELLEMMADAAGTAFENAKLYEQSNVMIHELRMINELTQRLSKSLHLADIYQFANQELRKILGAHYCCILVMNEELGALEVASCNAPWLAKEVFPKEYGIGGYVYQSKEPFILADYAAERPAESKLMETTGSSSMIATPLMVNGGIRGVILMSHRKKHYFSYDNYRLLQTLSSHIGLAVGNASLHAEVRRMANRDMLTELYARHYLDEAIQKCQSRDFCGSLILVDIDHFKRVNDTFGHQKGDKILKQVSNVIKSSIRQSDIAARWGGEELAVYLPGLGIDQAFQVGERIRQRVEQETDPLVTVSCGISEWNWTQERISVESLFYRADMALYQAKNSGRNQIMMEETESSGD